MRIKQALAHAIAALKSALDSGDLDSHRPRYALESELLLGFVLGRDRVWLHAHDDYALSSDEVAQFFALINKRAQGQPIEYLTNRVSFLDMELFVDPSVLIPRPESEILVQKAQALLESILESSSPESTPAQSMPTESIFAESICTNPQQPPDTTHTMQAPRIIEIGVGSGALSIALARALPQVQITATDISPQALAIARRNIEHFGLQDRIELVETSLFEGVDVAGVVLVLSNPPYIAQDYPIAKSLHFEPACALFGGERGDEILARIIQACERESIPALACEIGYDQRACMQQLLESSGYEAEFYTDLAGLDRGFVALRR